MTTIVTQRNQDATCYVGNLDEKVNEEILWELFLQVGPVVHVHMPKDKVSNTHQGYGFVEFRSEDDADYAIKVLNMIKLYGKPMRVNKAAQDKKTFDIGANLFIGNLDPDADEKVLYDTFSAFGTLLDAPKIMRDPDTGNSRGYGFVQYDSFEAADYAIECMNGQFLAGRSIVVQYAYKKDSKGERHGTAAERMLAAVQGQGNKFKPNTLFAAEPGQAVPAYPSAPGGAPQGPPGASAGFPSHGPPGFPPAPPSAPGYSPAAPPMMPAATMAMGGQMPFSAPPQVPTAIPHAPMVSGKPRVMLCFNQLSRSLVTRPQCQWECPHHQCTLLRGEFL
ncbi:Sf3b4 [Symbiodinium sp. KB8]|nr:Sf3b4 [Symbiodinium sp. KB8]